MAAPARRLPATRPLGALGLAVAGGLLLGFHQVVEGALQRAQQQQALHARLSAHTQVCGTLHDPARQALCELRAEQRLARLVAAGTPP